MFWSVECKISRLLMVSVYSISHYSSVNRLNSSWLDDLTSVPGRVQLRSVWHLAVGHLNSCAVGTRDNAARPFYWASVIIYCWNVSCIEFALCDFMTWHSGTEKTFPFILLVQVLRPVCWFSSDSVEFLLCTSPRKSWQFIHHPF